MTLGVMNSSLSRSLWGGDDVIMEIDGDLGGVDGSSVFELLLRLFTTSFILVHVSHSMGRITSSMMDELKRKNQ